MNKADNPVTQSLPSNEELSLDFFSRVMMEITKARDDDRVVVLVAHGFVELMVNTLIEVHCKNGKRIAEGNRDYPHSTKLVLLHELSLIDDELFARLNW